MKQITIVFSPGRSGTSMVAKVIALTESSKWERLGNLLKQIRRNPFRTPLIISKSFLATFFRKR